MFSKKIIIIFGTRPEAIKMAPVVMEFKKHPHIFEVKVCITAQHREMLDQVLRIFQIIPDYDLNLMAENQGLLDLTSRILNSVGGILNSYRPDLVLVHGDTTTSMVSAMAAFYSKIKIGHVEAGLRTNNLSAPWPEEMNRQVTDRISDFYFAPTQSAKENLIKENVQVDKIFITGNTVIDALLQANSIIQSNKTIEKDIQNKLKYEGYDFSRALEKGRKYILVTGHRRENFGDGFLNICKALKTLAENNKNIDIIYPVHLNPNVKKPVYSLLSDCSNIFLIPPVDYIPFVYLMKHCHLILTDSGGIQEEAPSLGKPVLVMREMTERPEALNAGSVILVGTDVNKIIQKTETLMHDSMLYDRMTNAINPYGDGLASRRIVESLIDYYEKK